MLEHRTTPQSVKVDQGNLILLSIQIQDVQALIPRIETIHFDTLTSELNLTAHDHSELKRHLAVLLGYGLISEITPKRYQLIRPQIQGTLTMNPKGFGFVIPENSDEANLFIDHDDLGGAFHRDRVALSLYSGRDGRHRGRVTTILERGTVTFVGIYRQGMSQGEEAERSAYLYPQNERLPTQIPVELEYWLQSNPILPEDGDLVAALLIPPETTTQQTLTQRAQKEQILEGGPKPAIPASGSVARILHVIKPDTAQGALEAVIYDQGLTLQLSSQVEKLADEFPDQPSTAEKNRRKDLRHLPFVTIDPASAKDFDDAIYVQARLDEHQAPTGGWKLWVAIADVAHFVTEGSMLDTEAAERSATLYLPAQAFPMLPHRLSNDLCSLRPKVDRLAMVAEINVNPQGELQGARFHEAMIHSQARFTYDQAASLIGALPSQELPKHLVRMTPQILALRDCARALQLRRRRRGFLNLELAEPRINFNERGMVEGFKVAPRHEAHEMVEEAMLAANECVASHCIEIGLPALYRIHAPPPDYGIERFDTQSSLLGAPLGAYQTGQKKGEAKLKKLKAHQLSKYLKKHEDHPRITLLSSLLLRSMSKALYEAEPGLHFGLGTKTYLHFTSPIRRYPDLWVHRQLKLWLQAQKPHKKGAEGILHAPSLRTKTKDGLLPSAVDPWEVAAYASRRERLIVDAERRVLDAYKALFMKDHIGESFEGFICNTSQRGCLVELNDYPIWCSVDAERLPSSFEYDEERYTWFDTRSRRILALGTMLKVKVLEVKIIEGKVEVEIEGL